MRRHSQGGLGVAAAAFVFVAALLSGCMRGSPPGSAMAPGAPVSPPPAAAAVESVPATPLPSAKDSAKEKETVVTVGPGDTLYSIARAHDVPIRDLIQWNGLDAPYELKPGRTLRLPAQRIHVVASGDTVYSISRRYGADMTALTRANGIAPPYSIAAGQKLRLPPATIAAGASPAQAGAAAAPASVAPAPASMAQPAAGKTTVEAVPLPPPPAAPAPAAAASKPAPAAVADAGPQPAATPAAVPDIAPEPKPSAQAAATAAAPASGAASFLWPLHGKILSAYGVKKGGEHNDGINIEAARGAPVRAAADGTVIYAGNELRGFGNLILIKHDGGWTTAYAHNDSLLVAAGVPVKRGQVIAKAGSTGNVPTPQLHFELRRGTRAVNPGDYLTATAESPAVNRAVARAVPPNLE